MINSVKWLLILILVYTGQSRAQESDSSSPGVSGDSLFHYMQTAGENNPLVMQRLQEYRASLQKIPQVGTLPDPEFTAGVFLTPMELISGNQVAELSLMQMFPWFGVLKNAKDEMSLMSMAKYESFKDAKSELYYNVQRIWYQLYILKEDISIAEKNIEILRTIERLALTRFKLTPVSRTSSSSTGQSIPGNNNSGTSNPTRGGMNNMGSSQTSSTSSPSSGSSMQGSNMAASPAGGSLSDLYRIQIEIAELDDNIAQLKNSRNTLQAEFNALLNRPSSVPVYLPDSITADTLVVNFNAIADSMLRNNPMLTMLTYEQQSLEARRRMNTAMGYPMVGLGLNYSLVNESAMSESEMNGTDMIMPMVRFTLPLYRKKYKAMQQEAVLLKSSSGYNYQSTANSLQAEIHAALQSYLDAQRRMNLYKNQHTLAKKTLDLMIRDFSASGSALTDILRIRQQTLDYEFKQVEALANYNTSIAYIRRLMATNGVQ